LQDLLPGFESASASKKIANMLLPLGTAHGGTPYVLSA